MRQWKAILVCVTAALISLGGGASSLFAQANVHPAHKVVHVYATGSLVEPVGELGDQSITGTGGGLALGVAPRSLSDGEIELVFRGQYEKFPAQIETQQDITILSGGLDLKYNTTPYGPTNVYLMMGGGLSQVKWSEWTYNGQPRPERDETDLYGEAGLGLEYVKGPIVPFVQVRFKDVTGKFMGNYFYFKFEVGLKL